MRKATSLLLVLRIVLFLILPALVLAKESKETTIEHQNKNQTLIKIEKGNLNKIIPNSPLEISAQVFFNQEKTEEPKKLSWEEEHNQKRLDLYKKRLESFNPPAGKIEILVTGYSSTVDQCDADPFTTASGTKVHLGTMACPPQYPFGTKIKIEGVGNFVCEDRGGAIKGNHFDMWFPSRSEALQWGKKTVVAEITK